MREIRVRETYASKSVLVTGATGFLGKVLVEKLLRSCEDVDKIYILMRGKKGVELKPRFDNYKMSKVFDQVRKSDLDKLIPVEGDLMAPNFAGISEANIEELKENVNFVFHCAATVRFDEPMDVAVKMNVIGTRNILDLSESFKALEAFVHVSTAFSNTNQKRIMEKIYDPICDYKTVIDLVEGEKRQEIEELNDLAMQTFPNTYIFTKNMAEQLVGDRVDRLPITIVRPSIVCPSYTEPHPGWTDNKNGVMGVMVGASSGLLRYLHGIGDMHCDLIPCDFVVNNIIVAGASVATSENKDLVIYNCISSKQLPITWNEYLDLIKKIYPDYPATKVLWIPGGGIVSNYFIYLLLFTLTQFLPACLLDVGCLLAGQKTWAVKLQMRIFESLKVFSYFVSNEWEWDNKNTVVLHKLIMMHERSVFNFDVGMLDYHSYITNWVVGSRRFLLKLDETSIPDAKRKYLKLSLLDFTVKILFFIGLVYFLFKTFM